MKRFGFFTSVWILLLVYMAISIFLSIFDYISTFLQDKHCSMLYDFPVAVFCVAPDDRNHVLEKMNLTGLLDDVAPTTVRCMRSIATDLVNDRFEMLRVATKELSEAVCVSNYCRRGHVCLRSFESIQYHGNAKFFLWLSCQFGIRCI